MTSTNSSVATPPFVPYLDRKQQQQIILSALGSGPKTTDQLRALGCFQAPTRVFELRAQGHQIETELVTAWAADGRPHPRMALYTLTKDPVGGTA